MEKKESQIRTWYKFALQQMVAESCSEKKMELKGISIALFLVGSNKSCRVAHESS